MTDPLAHLTQALSDRYTIEREIGSGGMATVYLAEDVKHHRKVAVKVLRPELAAALGPDRFLQEIEIAAQLHHPHILPLYDSGDADGFLYYVMPYEEGQSLREKLAREGELPIAEAVRILHDVVDALSHAHKHNVVHRDIKPDNVMLSERHALVTDFGVAKAVSEATGRQQLTTEGVALGTPTYMAPEQAAADPHIDHRADIYAVGVVAYELLTGRTPFLGTTPQMILSAHMTDTPDPVSKYRESVPPALEQLVLKCLEKKAADRWQSAEELLPLLEALATPSGGVTPSTTRPLVTVGMRKRKRVVWGGVATLTAVVAAVAVLVLPRLGVSSPELDAGRVVVIPFENRTGDATLDELGVMAADYIGQAIQQVEGVEVVPATYARQYSEDATGEGSSVLVRAVAERTNAGLVVSGIIYEVGDSLQFRVEIIDINSGAPVQSVDEVWARDSRREAISNLGQRVSGVLAHKVDPFMSDWTPQFPSPPTLEAYREHRLGYQFFDRGDMEAALEHHLAAYALDTTLVRAVVGAGYAARDRAQRDSLARFADDRRHLLSRAGQLDLDILLAGLENDWDAALRAARELARIKPGSFSPVAQALFAIRVNRPQEAVDALPNYDPHLEWRREEARVYWSNLTTADHMLGNHEQELVEARRARDLYPNNLYFLIVEIRALAALGRVEEVRELLDQAPVLSQNPSQAAIIAGLELRAHGHPEVAQEAFERAIEWLEARPPEEAAQPGHRRSLAGALYRAERWEEAREVCEGLAAESPDDITLLAGVGRSATRMGDTATALEISQQIAEMPWPDRLGEKLYEQARLAAVLGQPDEAMRLLRDAFFEGMAYGIGLHRDMDLESLREREDYQELMRPKG